MESKIMTLLKTISFSSLALFSAGIYAASTLPTPDTTQTLHKFQAGEPVDATVMNNNFSISSKWKNLLGLTTSPNDNLHHAYVAADQKQFDEDLRLIKHSGTYTIYLAANTKYQLDDTQIISPNVSFIGLKTGIDNQPTIIVSRSLTLQQNDESNGVTWKFTPSASLTINGNTGAVSFKNGLLELPSKITTNLPLILSNMTIKEASGLQNVKASAQKSTKIYIRNSILDSSIKSAPGLNISEDNIVLNQNSSS